MEDPQRAFSRKFQERLAASRFFTFSLLLHVILVVMGGSVVLFQRYEEPPDFAPEGGGLLTNEVTVAPPPDVQPDLAQQQSFAVASPSIQPPSITVVTSTTMTQTPFTMQAAPVQIRASAPESAEKLQAAAKLAGSGLRPGLPASMAGRVGGTQRQAAMAKFGGKEKSEKAVLAGLRWLKANQNSDGSWGKQFTPAMTGFAILSFLGHGELPESPEFGANVRKGLDWLLTKGNQFQGRMSMTKNNWGAKPGVYEHAIATYALCEYYTMSKDERFVELLKQAVRYIVQGQDSNGGWQYMFNRGVNSDTSVSGWCIQALKAAHLTQLEIPGVDEALDKAMLNLKRVRAPDGSIGYNKAGDRDFSLTGVGVLCTYFWKQDRDELVKSGIDSILKLAEKEYPVQYKAPKADLYAWYYDTQACLMFGGNAWNKWNHMFQDEIADSQNPDGSWPPVIAEKVPGAELQRDPGGDGRFYRTSLCILMLEVFYRYMPTTR